MGTVTPDEELLLSRRVITAAGCWELAGQPHRRYGQVSGRRYAHRLAHEMWNGPIPDGMIVCHRCDNPPCFNPHHLFVGDKRVNLFDAHRKGRWRPSERRTHCWRGHEFTPENVFVNPRGNRECRTCRTAAVVRYAERHRHPLPLVTVCPRGHQKERSPSGVLHCRICNNAATRAYKAKLRGASEAQDRDAAERLGKAMGDTG